MKYENRIVAFIDILGFKDLLDKTTDKDGNDQEETIDYILDAYKVIRETWDLDDKFGMHESMKLAIERENEAKRKVVSIFSDSIVVSFLETAQGEIYWSLSEIQWMVMNLVNRGILCRGALSSGKLIHTDKIIFGPALVEAYNTESKAALYPRIIISRELIALAGKYGRHPESQELKYLENILKKDGDGMYYIDYFLTTQNEMDDPNYDFPDYIEKIAAMVKKGSRSLRPDVRIKYMWMREKVNDVIDQFRKESVQKEFKKKGYADLALKWAKMKKA